MCVCVCMPALSLLCFVLACAHTYIHTYTHTCTHKHSLSLLRMYCCCQHGGTYRQRTGTIIMNFHNSGKLSNILVRENWRKKGHFGTSLAGDPEVHATCTLPGTGRDILVHGICLMTIQRFRLDRNESRVLVSIDDASASNAQNMGQFLRRCVFPEYSITW